MDLPDPPDGAAEFFEDYLPRVVGATGALGRQQSSVGSMTFRVLDGERVAEWSLRLVDGEVSVTRGTEDDVVVQVTVPASDFGPLVVESVRRARSADAAQGLLKALRVDAETARLVRHVPGSILLTASDGPTQRRMLFTPGRREASLDSADCTIQCSLGDLAAVQKGEQRGMDLFTSGKLRLSGNVQIALALSSLFL